MSCASSDSPCSLTATTHVERAQRLTPGATITFTLPNGTYVWGPLSTADVDYGTFPFDTTSMVVQTRLCASGYVQVESGVCVGYVAATNTTPPLATAPYVPSAQTCDASYEHCPCDTAGTDPCPDAAGVKIAQATDVKTADGKFPCAGGLGDCRLLAIASRDTTRTAPAVDLFVRMVPDYKVGYLRHRAHGATGTSRAARRSSTPKSASPVGRCRPGSQQRTALQARSRRLGQPTHVRPASAQRLRHCSARSWSTRRADWPSQFHRKSASLSPTRVEVARPAHVDFLAALPVTAG